MSQELAVCDIEPGPGSPVQEKHDLSLWKSTFK